MKLWKILKCGFITLFLFPLHHVPAQWEQIPALSGLPVLCMVSINDSTLLVGGMAATLLRSTDHGSSWESVWGNGIIVDTVLSLGGGHGYIFAGANSHGSVYRSSDNGVNWNLSSNGLPFVATRFVYVDTVLYVATDFGVYFSTNHGDAWTTDTTGLGFDTLNPGSSNSISALAHIGSKLVAGKRFLGGVHSKEAGMVQWSPIGLRGHWDITIAGIDTTVFAATREGVYMYTGADSAWIERTTGLPSTLLLPKLLSADTVLILHTAPSAIYVSKDKGLHWELIGITELGSTINDIAASSTHVVVKSGTGAWRRAIGSIVLSAEGPVRGAPQQFYLVQNYPNPFNGIANFGLSISDWSDVRLSVYDLLGREVAVLLNERKAPGSYTVQWNSGQAPSGVYFVRMEAGSVVKTVRAVLVK